MSGSDGEAPSEVIASGAGAPAGDSPTEAQHDWASSFCGIDTRVSDHSKPPDRSMAHTVLDVLGYIPEVGALANLANAGLYAAEGNYGEAALNVGMAAMNVAVPEGGEVAGMAIREGEEVAEKELAERALKAREEEALDLTGQGRAARPLPDEMPPPPDGVPPAGLPSPELPPPLDPAPEPWLKPAADGAQPAAKVREDLARHLAGPDGWNGNNIFGTHNAENAASLVRARDPNAHVEFSDTPNPGIKEMRYTYNKANTGNQVVGTPKTVYDPKVYSDSKMLDLAKKAIDDVSRKLPTSGPPAPTYDVTVEGVNFRVYVAPGDGGYVFTNVHPIR